MIDFKSYKLDDAPEILVLSLTGHLNAENSDYLMNCVQGHIEDGVSRIILDCEELDFISSMGLGTLIRAMTRLKKLGGAVALTGARGAVADVIRLVHLNRLLSIYEDVDAAATAMKQQS
jgi:anti-sigma B factor antagonist